MKACYFFLGTAALFGARAGNAQLLDQPVAPASPARLSGLAEPFARGASPSRLYGGNETALALPGLFEDYRTDPKLFLGFDLNRHLALETGNTRLRSRGFHYVPPGRAAERAGAVDFKNFSSYVAAKLSVPVGDNVTAYGKLGVSYSEHASVDAKGMPVQQVDTGPYTAVGARYRLTDKATIGADVQRFGNSGSTFGGATNANGVRANLKIGF